MIRALLLGVLFGCGGFYKPYLVPVPQGNAGRPRAEVR
jgi:hypothetical protein